VTVTVSQLYNACFNLLRQCPADTVSRFEPAGLKVLPSGGQPCLVQRLLQLSEGQPLYVSVHRGGIPLQS
jgi:hypothetical protein